MNILVVSNLNGWLSEGPTYSVPNQVKSLSKTDNVFWYNLNISNISDWKKEEYYHDIKDFPKGKIKFLPPPFNKPDLVIVEQFYKMAFTKIPYELVFSKIPYLIIPRGELTYSAQSSKRLKKLLFNFLFFRKYAKKAVAIQYLTEIEKNDSGYAWNNKFFVAPNGVYMPTLSKKDFSKNSIICCSIGRIDSYHKGLDLLIEACGDIVDILKENKVQINIYGPDKNNEKAKLLSLIEKKDLQNIIFIKEPVFGREKEKTLLESDVFIITSRFEGHPVALIEALSYGLPVIASSGSNMKNEVENYSAGWTSDNDAKSISNALLKMISSKEEFLNIGCNSRKLALNYDWNKIASDSHDFYFNLLKK